MILERHTVNISDDSGRIAMLEKRTIGTDDAKEVLTRYVYSNHLQSASLELDGASNIISYEEIELARFANTKRSIKYFVGNIILMAPPPSRPKAQRLMP
ncbi:MAG: hypothetical protein EOO20_13385 [Chryseobacterium sp.]|nr:MAG: hypothetical protein EOO20_13385 [Chryseobacterium sp.]